ncbi:histone H1-delta-like [Dysidea avara]|uniref:histone H1-delta-like n=1 Tax=Dysidea avara TaxID=196820 RepID=UPI0033318A29
MSTDQKKTDAKPKKAAKGKPRAPAQHPKYSEMITAAIVSIKERGGCSRQKILKYIGANYKVSDGYEVHARLALKRMVQNGALIQTKGTGASGSFKLAKKPAEKKKTPKKAQTTKKPSTPKKKQQQKKTADKPKKTQKKTTPKKKPSTPKKAAAKKPATKKPQTKKSPAKPKKTQTKKSPAKKTTKK